MKNYCNLQALNRLQMVLLKRKYFFILMWVFANVMWSLKREHSPSFTEHQKDKKDQPKDRNENSLTKFSSKVYDIYSGVSEKVLGLFHKVIFLFNSIYESTNQNLLPKGNGNVVDKTVVSCMMLAVAVLLMVFVKRGSK